MNRCPFLLFGCLLLLSCNRIRIRTGDSLTGADLATIRKLHLLTGNEKIVWFYSEFRPAVAGNFYTERRLAKYWLDEKDRSKDEVSSAFYPEIKAIDTVYRAGAAHSPYLLVTKTDGSAFKVYANGSRADVQAFFEGALAEWERGR